jgi:hypothetical protein
MLMDGYQRRRARSAHHPIGTIRRAYAADVTPARPRLDLRVARARGAVVRGDRRRP